MSDSRRSGRPWVRRAVARLTRGDAKVPAATDQAAKAQQARQRRRVHRLRGAIKELSTAVTGREVSRAPSGSRLTTVTRRAILQRERARFVTALTSGSTWGEAMLTTTHGLLANGRPSEVVALALRLEMSGVSDAEVPVAMALAADHQGHPRLVSSELHRTEPATIAARAAVAGVRAGILTDDDDLIDAVLDGVSTVPTDDLVTVACLLRSSRRGPQTQRALTELAQRWREAPASAEVLGLMGWLVPSRAEVGPRREPSVAVLSSTGPLRPTGHKDGQSLGLGTVASLALVMHAGIGGPDGQRGTPGDGDAARDPVDGAVQLVPRDHSYWPDLPERLWTVASGRFPLSPFGIRPEFPFAPALEPFFLGFSLVGAADLDDASVDYLRSKEPVGCSDVTSVFMLLKAGVKAFYSGRIESTLQETSASVASLRPEHVCGASPAELDSLSRIVKEVSRLAEGTGLVNTPKVGTLVAARALGRPTQFRGRERGHARLDGPVHGRPGLTPEPELARRMVESLREIGRAVNAGEPPQVVRDAWARYWTADVQAAEELWRTPTVGPSPADAAREAAECIRAGGRRYGPDRSSSPDSVHVSLATDHNLLDQLPVTIEAIVSNTSRPLRLSILTRGVDEDVERRLAAAHPTVELSFYPCDVIDHGGRLMKHITASTMDRLLLPEVLDEVSRTVYVDIDALVVDDIGLLFDWDLEDAPLAARTTHHCTQVVAVNLSTSLEPELAREMRDIVLHQVGPRAAGINAGVLVMDLERMRHDDFCRTYVPWVSRYHLNDQEVMEFYAGDHVSVLPDRWNAWPYKEVVATPAILHWVGPFKPWRRTITREQHRWAHYSQLADERRRTAPETVLPSTSDH